MDSDTVVSGITNDSNEEIDVSTWENTISEKKEVLLKSLQKHGIETLKNKCKESKINTKLNKKETMIDDILIRFEQNSQALQKMLKSDIRKIAKSFKLKISGKKDMIIFTILDYHIDQLIFTLDKDDNPKVIELEDISKDIPKDIPKVNSLESEKQKMLDKLKEIENEMEKQRIEEQKQLEEQKRLEEEKQIEELKKKDEKKKKQQIPKQIRSIIWNLYIGDDMIKHKCLCCKKVTITNTSFEVGHVISEHDGGTLEVNNLRPICSACNKSMGTMNMRDYVLKYGLLI